MHQSGRLLLCINLKKDTRRNSGTFALLPQITSQYIGGHLEKGKKSMLDSKLHRIELSAGELAKEAYEKWRYSTEIQGN